MTQATDALSGAYTSVAKSTNDVMNEMAGYLAKIASDPGISTDTGQQVVSLRASLSSLRKVLPQAPSNTQPGSAEAGGQSLPSADEETRITPDQGSQSYGSPLLDSGQGASGGNVDATSATAGIATGNKDTGPDCPLPDGVQEP
jgi:hypothetical protein